MRARTPGAPESSRKKNKEKNDFRDLGPPDGFRLDRRDVPASGTPELLLGYSDLRAARIIVEVTYATHTHTHTVSKKTILNRHENEKEKETMRAQQRARDEGCERGLMPVNEKAERQREAKNERERERKFKR